MNVIQEEGARPIKAWVERREDGTLNIEDSALQQTKNLARLPFIASNGVALMPDVHAGIGSTVGSVIATDKAVIPAAVGVDIGCGMNAVRLTLRADQLPDSLAKIRDAIEAAVPLGAGGGHTKSRVPHGHGGDDIHPVWKEFHNTRIKERLGDGIFEKAWNQLGTLGSGNHFIELCLDESDQVWLMLHSGSRGVGNKIGTHFIERAKRNMEKFFINLPHQDLAYFPEETDDFNEYVEAVSWAQNYALENRRQMMMACVDALRDNIPTAFLPTTEAVNCHHNYVEKENHFGRNIWVTRKGAVRAREGDLGIIPGSMGQRSYIVRGKGNPQSYCSCSHGAGRVMSRTEARRRFSLADLIAQTEGVECRKDDAVLDEIPGSYKPIDQVMANQADLVEVVHELRAVLCVKGA
ncbi:RtcB family protein [Variovorax paradoxus]|uniref:3'-phosphate/5'-hydroxy nucleic acid ligase n=1 Tax=Variovorax paradoxus TaxID=34073 RepID=A0A5Q0M4M9_VARPD|nr:RtcB family protein [Variovorax paradoxus]QFZ84581.1 RtcB family protein [Variovorax paradoxus]